jgi:Rrf2 family protein
MAGRDDLTRPVSAAEIADAEGLPQYYLAKVMQDLVRARVLKSTRGRGGGFVLAAAPEAVTVLAVVSAVEDVTRFEHECVLGLNSCTDTAPCPMHDQWKPVRTAIMAKIRTMTVADLATEMARKHAAHDAT